MRREAVVEIVISSSMRITFCRLRLCVVIWMIPPERLDCLMPPHADFLSSTTI